MTETVAGAVARREPEREEVEVRLRGLENWLSAITPAHMPAAQLVALSIAQFRKSLLVRGDQLSLADAARGNPPSFYAAVAECARLGLVPGETFHYVPFRDRSQPGGVAVTGVTDWKGEVELIHRAGGVEAVVVRVVRLHDHFRWIPNQMRLPEHHIAPDGAGQPGLTDPADRGPITGAYCYVRYTDGGLSEPLVMHSSEIRKHYDVAKTKKFWGEWGTAKYHQEPKGAWTEDMFRKTVVHKHADSVPSSAEYLRAKVAAETRVQQTMPPEVAAGYAAQGELQNSQDRPSDVANPRTITGAVAARGGPSPAEQRARDLRRIVALFNEAGLPAAARLAVAGVMAVPDGPPVTITSPANLSTGQAAACAQTLEQTVSEIRRRGLDVTEELLKIAAANGWQAPAEETTARYDAEETAGDHASWQRQADLAEEEGDDGQQG